jgi:hypothetical protein
MENLNANDLAIDVEEQPGVLRLKWRGKSTDRQPARILDPFFGKALQEVTSKNLVLEMRFEELLHFNSSTIGCLIQAIQEARTRGVKVRLVYDSKQSWQRLSFDALRVFAKDNDLLELTQAANHGP